MIPYYLLYCLAYQEYKSKVIKLYSREKTDESVSYDENGEIHRNDGPAIIMKDGVVFWYIHGKNITSKVNHWIQEMDLPKYKYWNDGHRALFKLTFG